ncbi:hypothetical protein R77567_03893 [Ralstonia sp. LMG 32965]|uniref:Secreted protein n=1 Tax=Ralstonia flatus TaxID=3058601 RepID=A0AAD2FAJ0_9RALS|nr:hypothetical protein R77567_03893 [Ralstonia sp. LMG 32965]
MPTHLLAKTIFACCTLLSFNAIGSPWAPVPTKPEYEYLADSVHRIGDHVYLIHRNLIHSDKGELELMAPAEFSCGDRTMRFAWSDAIVNGKLMRRWYGKSIGRYAAQGFIQTQGDSPHAAFLNWACQLPIQPERLVNARRLGDGTLIQIDTGSFRKTGAVASFWTRHDYPQIVLDPPYNAPYDSKREFVRVNCDTKTYRISVGYDFTPEGAITDGMIERDDVQTPFDSTDDYALAIQELACSKSADASAYRGIGGAVSRPKTPLHPDVGIDDVPVPPDVQATAAKFKSILPNGPTVSVARITKLTTSGKFKDAGPMVFEIRPKSDGSTRVHEIYSPEFSVDRELVGLAQLKSKMNINVAEERNVAVTEVLTLGTSEWVPGGHITFNSQIQGIGKRIDSGSTCDIGQPVDASTVHAGLKGSAWPLKCKDAQGRLYNGYYVEELRYFVELHSESADYGKADYAIESIAIER